MERRARTVAGAVGSAFALALAWRVAPFGQHYGESTWRTEPTPMPLEPPPPEAYAAFTAPAIASIAAVVAGILLLHRRPLPGFLLGVAGLVVHGAFGGPSFGGFVPALVLSLGLLRARGLNRAAAWLPLLLVALWATWWDAPGLGLADWRMWSSIGTQFAWVLIPTLLVALAIGRRQTRAREQEEAIERAASDERLRLAREIHDVVGHSLSMISLQSGVALRVLDADLAQARTSLEAIRTSSKDALAELRHTLGAFRGDDAGPLAPAPSLAAVPALVDEVRAGGVRVDLAPLPDATGIGAAAQAAAYRVVQEALTNAIRHAPGALVAVAAERTPHGLDITVTNPLAPQAHPGPEGGGLRGMRERVGALGGTLLAGPEGDRFLVRAHLPTRERP